MPLVRSRTLISDDAMITFGINVRVSIQSHAAIVATWLKRDIGMRHLDPTTLVNQFCSPTAAKLARRKLWQTQTSPLCSEGSHRATLTQCMAPPDNDPYVSTELRTMHTDLTVVPGAEGQLAKGQLAKVHSRVSVIVMVIGKFCRHNSIAVVLILVLLRSLICGCTSSNCLLQSKKACFIKARIQDKRDIL